MPNTRTLIQSYTGNSLIFSSIPQTYTDLLVTVSGRDLTAGGGFGQTLYFQFNGDGSTLYSSSWFESNGGSAYQSNNGAAATGFRAGVINSTGATNAAIFGSLEIYIPGYTSAHFKSYHCTYATENNNANAYLGLDAGVYRSTSAITSFSLGTGFSLDSLCTMSLYGIKNS